MIKMNNEEDKNNNIGEDIDNKIGHIIPLGFKKQEESLFIQKGKEYMKNKKAISMRHIFENKDKINININQNININANIKTPEKEKQTENQINIQNEKGIKQEIIKVKEGEGDDSKPQSDEGKMKGKRMKSCIFNMDFEKKKDKKAILSMNVNRNKMKDIRDIDSSYKMEKLLEKQSKLDAKDEKKEQYIEFYINDNIKNKIFKLKDNTITTTKYNIFTFFPKGLLYQFSRLSNIYFLFTAIIQSIPLISPLTSITAIIPLIFVLGISLIRELVEDVVRNNFDNMNNEEEVIVLRNNRFIRAMSKTLKYGEIILVYENKSIPADMILIDSGFSEGICYVETSSLDGEKTLKLKVANRYTQGFISNDIQVNKGITKYVQPGRYTFSGFIKINAPNIDLNFINGTIHTYFEKEGSCIEENINISTNEFLLKGSILKNTNWIIGIVVYTGMNNKIILNSKKPRLKMSKVEKSLNYYLFFVFIFLIICCIICSIEHRFDYLSHKKFYDNFIFISNTPKTESFIIFFTYFLLLNTLIPISLIVSTEIIKLIQGIFIRWDILLYSKWRGTFSSVKAVSIIEELGNVNFIFSDKTGTLTKNQLQFKFCIINKKFYKYIRHGKNYKKVNLNNNDNKSMINNRRIMNTQSIMNSKSIINNKSIIEKKDNQVHKNSLMNFLDNSKRKRMRSDIFSKLQFNMSNKRILDNFPEESSIIAKEELNNLKYKKNSYSNNINLFNGSKLTFLKKINEREKFGREAIKYFDTKSKIDKNKINEKEKEMSSMNKSSKMNISKINKSNAKNSSSSFSSSSSHNSSSISPSKNSEKNEDDYSELNRKFSMKSSINNIQKNYIIVKKEGRNSTIFEVKGDEKENSVSNIREAVPFYEGYFSSTKNNPFLRNMLYDGIDFNYIHEFWKALALTNECMIKEIKGDIKYMSTSPDDLELVKAAARQGYKLIETNINTKTLRIAGKEYSYKVLKVLGFSSERKRMSVIVKDKNGIKLYIKGADCEISKRLSKKSLENENYEIISNGLIEFSKRGLRTLMVAYRRIRQEDYDSWVNRLHEDELNVQFRQRLIDRLYDLIENNLTLIGGTVVEDKLQDKVPETIKEFRSAGIKIWVLTGDKLDTAENIGHSCNLLSKEHKLFTLKVMPGDDENVVKDDPYPEMIHFFTEFQEFLDELIKKYNLDTKYNLQKKYTIFDRNEEFNEAENSEYDSHNDNENVSDKSSYSSKSKIVDFSTFNYLKEKNILEPFSIIIEAPILCGLFKDEEWTKNFLHIAYYSNTVICCRVSPSQKSQVIQKMKEFDRSAVTLAIGDGGNDVSMIMEANIGIGIYGEEGMSAVQASDFAIGEFKLLKRLLFIHGRVNLYRISKMILYFFYKNFVFTLNQFYFSFLSLASGQTFVDDWYITCYNLIFTALPLCITAVTDSDIDLNNSKVIKKNLALLYRENRDNHKIFSFKGFILTITKGMITSFIIFLNCCFKEILNIKGSYSCIWYLSLKNYICVLIVVSLNLIIQSSFIVYLQLLSIGITTFLLFMIFLILNHYGFLFEFNSKASIFPSLTSPLLYFTIILISSLSFIFDYTFKLVNLLINKSLSSWIFINKARKSKKLSFNINKVHSYKLFRKISKSQKRYSVPFQEVSRNFLLQRAPLFLNKINMDQSSTPKNNIEFKFNSGKDIKN